MRVHRITIATALAAAACASEPSSPPTVQVEPASRLPELAAANDAPPRVALTLRAADGSRLLHEPRALAHASSAAGAAVLDAQRRLVLVAADGTRRVLAEEAGAPPARCARGELIYVATEDSLAAVRVLDPSGAERVIASGLASAGLLAPQPDGSVLFVAAKNGGVAGLWRSAGGTAQCLTNCDLATGVPGGDRYVPPPGDVEGLAISGERVAWQGFDGKRHSVTLGRTR